jgi:intracellular multiplication protein IcmC
MLPFGNPVEFHQSYFHLVDALDDLTRLIVAISYVTGVALAIRGIMMYRIFANQTHGSSQRGELAGPMVFLIVGVILIYFPTTISSSMLTVFGTPFLSPTTELLEYESLNRLAKWSQLKWVMLKYMSLIGLLAFLRGWIILSKMGHSGSQPGSIGKGITHIVGGILLINIVQTVQIFARTLGFIT